MYYGVNVVLIFILGLIVGSFSNVCICRIPKNESIIFPASHCPKCHSNIQYPIVELLTGLIYLIIYLTYGLSVQTLIYIILSSALVIIAFIDLNKQIVPDVISLPGIVIGFVISFFVPYISFINSALGVVVGGGIILF